jgi:hypothetical protein
VIVWPFPGQPGLGNCSIWGASSSGRAGSCPGHMPCSHQPALAQRTNHGSHFAKEYQAMGEKMSPEACVPTPALHHVAWDEPPPS